MWNSWVAVLVGLALLCTSAAGTHVDYDTNALIVDGERQLIFSGAIHYPRSTPEMWPDLIQKAKDGGLNAIETYIFWNAHEPLYRQYDFKGNLDFIKFFNLIHQAGLHAILRIGPYVCAEWNYGGYPVWLHNIDGIEIRTDNEIYKREMQIFTTKIVDMCKEAKLFAPQGGPIILAQIENEYGNWKIMSEYGDKGKEYIKWAAKMADAQSIGVPWIMCQQPDAPKPMIETCNGFYCHEFKPNNTKIPKMFTELWTGWFKAWGQKNPHRTAEDLAYSVAKFFQSGGVLTNYYMYHGGTNFGRTPGGPYIATSYDYDAPLDEYGHLNQPKWGHLKELHAAIKSGEKIVTNGKPTTEDYGRNGSIKLTTFTHSKTGEKFCYLSNDDEKQDANVDLKEHGKFFVPAWSVSILADCKKEIYNTAKVKTQTSIRVMKQSDDEEKPSKLKWKWTLENLNDTLHGEGKFSAGKLLEQKAASADVSDYLWYMTSVDLKDTSPDQLTTLVANTSGQIIYAYVNGRLIGSKYGYVFQFRNPVTLRPGKNIISLLSVTVGLQNYGAFFDEGPEGVTGPVVLTNDNGSISIDLSSNTWKYKIGLNGEAKSLHDPKSPHPLQWSTSQQVPTARPMIWYKTTFKAPAGKEPVVVDLLGMGKGHAWVNGKSIGRFWPTRIAETKGCDEECDYRGKYKSEKCLWNCGNPTQRWYHIPRSFLNRKSNTLILFEEEGGDPSQISFQTVTVGSVCATANEGKALELSCRGGQKPQIISTIKFASYGNPNGACGGSFRPNSCHAPQTLPIVEKACVGKESCSIDVSKSTFGSTTSEHCGDNVTKRLVVQATCGTDLKNQKTNMRRS